MALIYSRINAQRFYLEPMLLSNITQYESRVTTPEYTFMNGNIGYKLGSPNWQLNRSINYGINAGIRGHLFHFEGGFFTDQATSMTHITLYKGVEERKLEYFQKLGTYRINTNFGVNILRFGSNKNPKSMHHELWIRVGMDAVFGREDPFVVHEKKESFELSGTNFEITESYYLNIYNHLKMINFGIKYRLNSGLHLIC